MVTSRHYSSAFAGPQNKVVSSFSFGEYDFRDTLPGKNYTIQLFTSFDTPADPILTSGWVNYTGIFSLNTMHWTLPVKR